MRCCSCDQPLVGEEEGFCRPCLVVLPDIVQIPDGSSIRSVVDRVSSLRDELGDPGPSLREIWKSIDNLPKRGDIDWLYRNEQNTQDEWRWITSPPPPLELDEESIRFLSDKMAPFRNREETIGVMRNLQRGGLLPSGEYLSWSGGDWSMDGKAIEVPFVLLRDMIKSNGGRKDIDWGALLRTIDLAVTKVLEMRNPDRPTKRAQTLSPAYYLLTRRNVHLSSFSSFDSEFGRKRISSFPSDFGDASWLRTWDHGGSDRPGMLHHHIDPDEAMQHVSLSIKNGKLLFKVRRPGGVFRNIRIPPNPDLVAKIVSWSLSRHTSAEFRRIDCIRTMIFAGRDSKLVEGPERTALKLMRSVYDSTDGCTIGPQGKSFRVKGTSGLFYEVTSCQKGRGPHGSRFRIRCLGPEDVGSRPPPWSRGNSDICIRESVGPKLPLGDIMVQAILTVSQDEASASRGIASIGSAISSWRDTIERREQRERRRQDPIGAHMRQLERLAVRLRGDWMHRRITRATTSFPALWAAIIRAPINASMRFTSLENARQEPNGANVVLDGVSTRFRTENVSERMVVRRMLLGAGWTRQTAEEEREGVRQIWRKTTRPDDDALEQAITNFCGLLDQMLQINGRRLPMAPENLLVNFEGDSEVYGTALLPTSRGFII